MTDTFVTEPPVAAVPRTFWLIAGVSLIWNLFGGYDYLMTRLRNTEYLSMAGDPQAILAWIDAMPVLAQILWPVGVWASVLGSVLMLARSRHAATAFAVSLIGAIGSFVIQLGTAMPAALDTTANKVMPLVIVAIIVALWIYCRKMAARGVLR